MRQLDGGKEHLFPQAQSSSLPSHSLATSASCCAIAFACTSVELNSVVHAGTVSNSIWLILSPFAGCACR